MTGGGRREESVEEGKTAACGDDPDGAGWGGDFEGTGGFEGFGDSGDFGGAGGDGGSREYDPTFGASGGDTTGFEDYEEGAALAVAARERESVEYLRKLERRLAIEAKKSRRRLGGKSFEQALRRVADKEFATIVASVGNQEIRDEDNCLPPESYGQQQHRQHQQRSELHEYRRVQSDEFADRRMNAGDLDSMSLLGVSERSDGSRTSPSSTTSFYSCFSKYCAIT